MSKVRADISVSLDGYVAGPDQSEENPLGIGGEQLHDWAMELRAWRESHGREGGEDQPALIVVGIAIWVTQRDEFFFATLLEIDTENLIDFFITDVQKARLVPYRAFGESETSGYGFKFGIMRNQS